MPQTFFLNWFILSIFFFMYFVFFFINWFFKYK